MPNEETRAVFAIHPIVDVYESQPAKEAMQAVLDDPRYHLAVCVTAHVSESEFWRLYVRSNKVISSYLNNHPDIVKQRIEKYGHSYSIINPEDLTDLFRHVSNSNTLEIMLMGGEVTKVEGCHHEAFLDLIHWFFNYSPREITTLKIKIDFKKVFFNLFFEGNKNEEFFGISPDDVAQIAERYRDSRSAQYEKLNDEILVTFDKTAQTQNGKPDQI